jgi:pimeloyl-ACP methyl ester carboxylesterase
MEWTSFEVSDGSTSGFVHGEEGELVLVLHGGPGLSDYTDALAREVHAGLGCPARLARYQQRGIAPSALEGPFTVSQLVDDLFSVVDHFGADSALLVGHSWGGHLALHAAIARPERVSALVLVDSLGAVGDGGAGTMEAIISARIGPEAAARVEELDALEHSPEHDAAMFELYWPGYFLDPGTAPPAPQLVHEPLIFEALERDATRLLEDGLLERALPGLALPSLHIIGRASPIDPAANRATAALLTGAMVEELETGHFPWLEQPGSVTNAVRRFRAASDQ